MSVPSAPQASQLTKQRVAQPCSNDGGLRKGRASRIGRLLDDSLRRKIFRRLETLAEGRLTVIERDTQRSFGETLPGLPAVELHVRDSRAYRRLAIGGSLGAAEAYFLGYWDCDRLVELLRLFYRNEMLAGGIEGGLARLFGSANKLAHRFRRNTLSGSRRNISAHYDLGDEFFSLFLDETMAYSCGIFPTPESTLREASLAKFERVCHQLQLSEQDHVMEIGSGWGGFAVYAAQNYGCRVTTTTISRRQYEFTLRRVREERLTDRVSVLCKDYRHLEGQFDKLVSIEMVEAVGYEYFDIYFKACSDLLKPDGMMLLQAITIPDQRFDQYRRSVDFIRRYVFPGGCLLSPGAICASVGRATDMRPIQMEDFTAHYALTLAHWGRRYRENIETIRALGFTEAFLRLWEFYFCSCEAAFREGIIGDVQLLLNKPKCFRSIAAGDFVD